MNARNAESTSRIAPIEDAIQAIREGRMVILVDDEDRENEGDLVIAADAATPETIAFMAREARGLICLALTAERCEELGLAPMTAHNTAPLGTAFTRSIDHRTVAGVQGIAASARATTIQKALDPATDPSELVLEGLREILGICNRDVLPYLVPALVKDPLSVFHAQALAALADVLGPTFFKVSARAEWFSQRGRVVSHVARSTWKR